MLFPTMGAGNAAGRSPPEFISVASKARNGPEPCPSRSFADSGMQPAGHLMSRAGDRRIFLPAAVHDVWTARVEMTTDGRLGRIGNVALQHDALAFFSG